MAWFSRPDRSTVHEEFHAYTDDLLQLTKLRQQAMQRQVIQPSESNQTEIDRYDTMIAVAQKVIVKLTRNIETEQ